MSDERRAILRITGPDIQQDTVEVTANKGIKVGRLAANDLALQHQKISRFHAEFSLTAEGLMVVDLGSSNGTQLGDDNLEANKPHRLKVGESVRMGPYVFTLEQLQEPAPPTPSPSQTVQTPAVRPKKGELAPTTAFSAKEIKEAAKAAEEAEKAEKAQAEAEAREAAKASVEPSTDEGKATEVKLEVPVEPPVPAPPAEPTPPAPAGGELPITADKAPDELGVDVFVAPPPTPAPPPPVAQKDEPKAEAPKAKAPDKPAKADKPEPFRPAEPPTIPPRVPLVAYSNGDSPEGRLLGIPEDKSSWLQYLPPIYSDDPFTGRFLLIFESIAAPLEWIIDAFPYYLSAEFAPPEWLQWFGSWLDVLVPASIPAERQRHIVQEMGTIFLSRGTPASLSRHLELIFEVKPDIQEPQAKPSTFEVILKLGKDGDTTANRKLAERIIESHRPAHTLYTLTIK